MWFRITLLFLAASTLGGSLWALPFPRSFYNDFPVPGWDWVSTLGPYNEHLVTDYGAMNLALGVLLVSAAISLEKRLTQAALLTYLAFATPHFLFHAAQTHHFPRFTTRSNSVASGSSCCFRWSCSHSPEKILSSARAGERKRKGGEPVMRHTRSETAS